MNDSATRKQYPNQGRWLSPDPAGLGAVDLNNPQSWNRYAYVGNTPTSFVDPLGLQVGMCGSRENLRCGSDPAGDNTGFWMWNPFDVWIGFTCREDCYYYFIPGGGDFLFNNTQCYYALASPCGGSGGNAANNGNPIVPANPCNRAGNAPDPSVYQAKGQTGQNNAVADFYNLFQFRAGGGLDAQPQGASPSYANYAFGVYTSAAGYNLNQALTMADIYAQYRSSYRPGTVMDPNYQFTPEANVMNITYGFDAQQTGTLCHK